MPKVTQESAVKPRLARSLSLANGYGSGQGNTLWPDQRCEICAASAPTPQCAPLHRWHFACPVGAAASWTAGTPRLGAVEPTEPRSARRRRMLCMPR